VKTRRRLAWGLLVPISLGAWLASSAAAQHSAAAAAPSPNSPADLAQYVNPFSGTDSGATDYGTGGGGADTFPGAVLPFGMVQWSPDTTPSLQNHPGGYTYRDTTIRGFSLTHLSGTGCANFGDAPFLPHVGAITQSPAKFGSSDTNYTASFSHSDEEASPGYYRVRLDPGSAHAVNSELTVTPRSGFGRFTYPATSAASMIINTGGSAMADRAATVAVDPAASEVSGSATSGLFCYQQDWYTVYFAARFSRPFSAYGTWNRQTLAPGSTSNSDYGLPLNCQPSTVTACPPGNPSGTAQTGAYVSFDTTADPVVDVRVGVSFTSVAAARRNLDAENPGWNFDAVYGAATQAWNRELNRVQVNGGSLAERRMLYIALYHALLFPSVYSDVDGRYLGMDGQPHTAQGYTQYANFSGWDIYRSEIQLLALLEPQRTSDMMQSLVADARESGWLPKWPVASGQADVMVGDPADPIIASAYAFGATSFDTRAALSAMVKGATAYGQSANDGYVERQASKEYQALGFVPHEENQGFYATAVNPALVWAAAATTLEYTTADFAIARFAGALCDATTYQAFMHRSDNWRKLFNPATGYLQPRYATGAFDPTFSPTSETGWAEGDGAQYRWMVPHNIGGLGLALGGKAATAALLDTFFTRLNAGPDSPYAFLGNEPTLETPWEYDWVGQPYKAQATVRRTLLGLYNASPGGYPGNDDMGEMSSWWVFGALGLFPEVPGVGLLAVSSPLFPRTVVHLAGGDLVINAPAAADAAPYVTSLSLNGQAYQRAWLPVSSMLGGATLDFTLSTTPDPSWGSSGDDAPPSFGPDTPVSSVCGAASPRAISVGGAAGVTAADLPNTASSLGKPSGLAVLLVVASAGLVKMRLRRRRRTGA